MEGGGGFYNKTLKVLISSAKASTYTDMDVKKVLLEIGQCKIQKV